MSANSDNTVDGHGGSTNVALNPVVDFIAGTCAGVASLAVGYPFDTVKVRIQSPQISSRYTSTFQAFVTIAREEKIGGLYKGIVSPMVSCAPLNGLLFSSYRFFMRAQLESDRDEPTITQVALSGTGTGLVASAITCPIELLKIRQQNILDSQPSVRSLAMDIWRRHGIRGLYRGITATALRDAPGYGVYFATYEASCRYFSNRRPSKDPESSQSLRSTDHSSLIDEVESDVKALSWPALLAAGALAGISGWLATFPFDVVKTRVQGVDYLESTSSTSTKPHPYRTTLSTIAYSYRTEGMRVFFRGLAPTLMRAVPVNMTTFGVFEGIVYLLSK